MNTVAFRTSTAVVIALIVAAAPLSAPSPSVANHRGQAASGVLDTDSWRVCITVAPNYVEAAYQRAVNRINGGTSGLFVGYAFTCSEANISARGAAYPQNPNFGWTTCQDWGPGDQCRLKWVRVNTSTTTTQRQANKTALHEFGHVGGMGHRFNNISAMTQGASPPVSDEFSDHDYAVLDVEYP